MEKTYTELLKIPYQNLVNRIVIGVRGKATTIDELAKSRCGAIRITMVPLSSLCEAWLGGKLSDFGERLEVNTHDVCEREFVYPLFPGGSHTMQYTCEDGHIEPVNCYAYSALKVAYASWKRKFDKWVDDNDIPENLADHEFHVQTQFFAADNGYSLDEGVVYTTTQLNDQEFLRLYVTVSGAQTGKVDMDCAVEGMRMGQEFFEKIDSNIEFELDEQLNFLCIPEY